MTRRTYQWLIFTALFLLLAQVALAQSVPPFRIAIDDNAPVTDVIFATTVINDLTTKGYTGFPAKVSQLLSEVDLNDLTSVTLILNNGKAVIIISETASSSQKTFANDIAKVLQSHKYAYELITSAQAETKGKDELFEKNPVKETYKPVPLVNISPQVNLSNYSIEIPAIVDVQINTSLDEKTNSTLEKNTPIEINTTQPINAQENKPKPKPGIIRKILSWFSNMFS